MIFFERMEPSLEQSTLQSGVKWHEVTWYSKLGAIILFCGVVPAVCFYIGMQYESLKIEKITENSAVRENVRDVLNAGSIAKNTTTTILGQWKNVNDDPKNEYTDEYNMNGVHIARHNGIVQVYNIQNKAFLDTKTATSSGKWSLVSSPENEKSEWHERFPNAVALYLPEDPLILKEDYGSLISYYTIRFSEDGNTMTTKYTHYEQAQEETYTRLR